MMNSLSNELSLNEMPAQAISFSYKDMTRSVVAKARELKPNDASSSKQEDKAGPPRLSEEEVKIRVNQARAEAVAETEKRLNEECAVRLESEALRIRYALELFETERKEYFSRVESEVIQLSLAIAAKILHRESQVDPLLVAGLVRVAIDKLHDGSNVSVRVSPARAELWRKRLANPSNGSTVTVIEDAQLCPEDCIMETDLGSANFSIDAQLKEVEQGFFDLLAQRPCGK